MFSTVHFLLNLTAFMVGLVLFSFGLSVFLYPYYAGGWPVFLFYIVLFLAAFLLPIKAGLNARFFKALVAAALFNFLFLYIAQANISTPRTVYFEQGSPTLQGLVFQLTICVGVLMFATGMSAAFREFSEHLNNYFSKADGK